MKISKTLVPWLPRNPTWGLYNKQHNIIHTKEHMDFYILHFFITSLEVIHILIPINLDTLPSFLLLMKVFLHVKSNQMSLATNQTTIWFISSFRVPWPLKAVKLQNLKIFFLVIETHKHTLHFFCLKIGFLVRHFFFILSCVWFYHQLDTPPSLPCHTHTHTSYWFHQDNWCERYTVDFFCELFWKCQLYINGLCSCYLVSWVPVFNLLTPPQSVEWNIRVIVGLTHLIPLDHGAISLLLITNPLKEWDYQKGVKDIHNEMILCATVYKY